MKKAPLLLILFPIGFFNLFIYMGFNQESDDTLEFKIDQPFEAEAGKINGPIQKFDLLEASGGSYIRNHATASSRLSDPYLQELPDVSYALNIPEHGNYFLWLYVKAPVIQRNEIFGKYLSLYIGSDNQNYNLSFINVNNDWQWQRITNLWLRKGKRTIDFKHNDWNFGIDQLYITATGLDLTGLGKNPSKQDILKANLNVPNPITYPALTEEDGAGLVFPTPPAVHPRLFLRDQDISKLKAKTNDQLMKNAWDKIVASSKEPIDGMLNTPVDGMANFNLSTINAIEAKALMYVLYKDKTIGSDAKNTIFNFFRTVKYNPSAPDISRVFGRILLMAAIVYDWCYDLLSKEEKAELICWIETMASRMEIGWPVIRQSGSIVGHQCEFQLMRDLLAGGIATYDEKKEMYLLAAGRFFKDYITARAFFYPGGFHHQGSSYVGLRFLGEIYATALFDKMGYPNIFGDDQKKVPYYAFYTRRPDGQIMRDGDDYVSRGTEEYWSYNGASNIICASLFKDPVIMGEAMRELKGFGNTENYLFDFVLGDPYVKPEPIEVQPLAKFFPSPLGAMVARTGWDMGKNSSTVVASMKIGEYYFGNHQHLDAGNFQLYYKGALASEGGCYDSYGGRHDYNYHKRTVAHNSMLVFDPTEHIIRKLANDGGQRFPNEGRVPNHLETVLTKGYKVGETKAQQFGPDPVKPEYTYVKGDLTQAYTNKIKQFNRSFVFLNLNNTKHPAVLIVFDKVVSTNKDFKKSWLLHSIEEPVIDGMHTTIGRTQKGYNGKLVNITLYPLISNLKIIKVGGQGRESEVMGINYAAKKVPDPEKTSDESGSWRIEVSPKNMAENDIFLNVMQVMDNVGGPKPLVAERINSDQVVGTMINDRVVLFSRDGEKMSKDIKFTLNGSGILKVLVTDLKEGYWKIAKSGEKAKAQYEITEEGSALYFYGSKGQYALSRSNSKISGGPPADLMPFPN